VWTRLTTLPQAVKDAVVEFEGVCVLGPAPQRFPPPRRLNSRLHRLARPRPDLHNRDSQPPRPSLPHRGPRDRGAVALNGGLARRRICKNADGHAGLPGGSGTSPPALSPTRLQAKSPVGAFVRSDGHAGLPGGSFG